MQQRDASEGDSRSGEYTSTSMPFPRPRRTRHASRSRATEGAWAIVREHSPERRSDSSSSTNRPCPLRLVPCRMPCGDPITSFGGRGRIPEPRPGQERSTQDHDADACGVENGNFAENSEGFAPEGSDQGYVWIVCPDVGPEHHRYTEHQTSQHKKERTILWLLPGQPVEIERSTSGVERHNEGPVGHQESPEDGARQDYPCCLPLQRTVPSEESGAS